MRNIIKNTHKHAYVDIKWETYSFYYEQIQQYNVICERNVECRKYTLQSVKYFWNKKSTLLKMNTKRLNSANLRNVTLRCKFLVISFNIFHIVEVVGSYLITENT